MRKITFYRWLNLQIKRKDPVGDLARDAYRSNSWGEESLKNLKSSWFSHLCKHGACEEAIDSLDIAWKEYKK